MNSTILSSQENSLRLEHTLFLLPLALPFIGWPLGLYYDALWLSAWFTVLILLVAVPILDYLIGEATFNPHEEYITAFSGNKLARTLPTLTLPLWLGLYFWGLHKLEFFNLSQSIGWLLSLSFVAGICLINVAHELVHRNTVYERTIGGLLLASVWNLTFKIEHVRGHHREVATAQDHSTALYNQNIYAFILKAMYGNVVRAWALEQQRLQAQKKHFWHNEILRFSIFSLGLTAITFYYFGLKGVLFYVGVSFLSNSLLEIINFIEHYGLLRKTSNGQLEPVGQAHAWNSNYWLSNALLLNLQRHSDHHMNAGRPYTALRHFTESPQLPFGYAAMLILALIPPLWRKNMHPRMIAMRDQK